MKYIQIFTIDKDKGAPFFIGGIFRVDEANFETFLHYWGKLDGTEAPGGCTWVMAEVDV